MQWQPMDTWIVIVGALCAASCALPGALLVLRRMSMMGDAISHTVLPGLAVAFLITESRDPGPMLGGAIVVGVLTTVLVQAVRSLGRTEVGAAMGIVFTTLFALGLILMRQAVDHVDIDPDCVLYGAIELAPMDTVGGSGVPRAALINGGMLVINLVLLLALYKELKISSFDPALATTVGINAQAMHYLLMTMTAATAVSAFETVGSVLVIAMLIVPGATAYLLTDRLGVMMVLSVGLGVLAAVLGHVSAVALPPLIGFSGTSTAGMMACMAGVLFAAVWLAAPRHGLIGKAARRARLSLRILGEDVLGLLYRLEEMRDAATAASPLFVRRALDAGPLSIRLALRDLRRRGLVGRDGPGDVCLTGEGRRRGAELVRTHRLWESFLHKHLHLAADHVHDTAERLEHFTSEPMRQRLAAQTGRATHDPHGKAIPPEERPS